MWRLILAVGTGYRSGLDRRKPKSSFIIHRHSTITRESRFQKLRLCVLRMRVLALRIGLPDLQHCIWHRHTVAIENAPLDRNPLAGDSLSGEIVLFEPPQPDLEIGSNGLPGGRL